MIKYNRFRTVLPFAVIIIILLIALPHFHSSRQALHTLAEARPGYIVLAIMATFATFLFSVGIYKSLAFYSLSFPETLLVQFAAMFINRLAPAGSGAIGINAVYLHAKKHSIYQAGTVATMNNLIGLAGHSLLLVALSIFTNQSFPAVSLSQKVIWVVIAGLVIASILAVIFRRKVITALVNIAKVLASYRRRPGALMAALGLSLLLTSCNVLTLWLACRAVGVSVSLPAAMYALTAGVAAGAAVPTPGGLGGVEAGIYGVLIVYQHNVAAVAAAVLIYRLINYWMPFLLGAVAFYVVQRRRLLGF